jgi:hypothetical protein
VITRVFIDNYKCFSNFECQFGNLQLLLGDNGTGKTSLFDVLEALRKFITLRVVSTEAFPTSTLTAWDKRSLQTFELEVRGNQGIYFYRLIIEHDKYKQRNRIKSEELQYDNLCLYQFDGRDAHLYRDDGEAGPIVPFDWSFSMIPTIAERLDNKKLSWFRQFIEKIHIFSPDPIRMVGQSDSELSYPDRRLHRIFSWYRHLVQEDASFGSILEKSLKEVIEGLDTVLSEKTSENSRVWKFGFDFGNNTNISSSKWDTTTTTPEYTDSGQPEVSLASLFRFPIPFEQLSDGQRNLIALYLILHSPIDRGTTFCIDEPDNYVSLREIQPWIVQICDRIREKSGQCLIISHNPELIDYMAPRSGLSFSREESGPVRVKPFVWSGEEALSPSKLIARGWK